MTRPEPLKLLALLSEPLVNGAGDPEQYRALIVRVAGYRDYFCDLDQVLQNEIIVRTEQTEF